MSCSKMHNPWEVRFIRNIAQPCNPAHRPKDRTIISFKQLEKDPTDIATILMPIPFGLAVGDFLIVADIAVKISKALS